jgi:hypothetical protein
MTKCCGHFNVGGPFDEIQTKLKFVDSTMKGKTNKKPPGNTSDSRENRIGDCRNSLSLSLPHTGDEE